jgi:hypothetical protein
MLPLRFPYLWLVGGLFAMAVVLVLALVPTGRLTAISFLSDKTSHFIAFAVLMTWFCGVFRLPMTPLAALGLLGFGLLIEMLQSMLPYRSSEVRDVYADLLGIGAGWLLALAGMRHWTRWVEARLPGRLAP